MALLEEHFFGNIVLCARPLRSFSTGGIHRRRRGPGPVTLRAAAGAAVASPRAAWFCVSISSTRARIYGHAFSGDKRSTRTTEREKELPDTSQSLTARCRTKKGWAGLTEQKEVERTSSHVLLHEAH
jgi:hypothetical protein